MMLRKFKILTDDIVGLFVKVTIGSIYHVSRSNHSEPTYALHQESQIPHVKAATIVTSLLLDFQNTVDVKVRLLTNQATSSLGIPTQPMPRQPRFPPLKPSTVFIFFSPNVRHLWARVTFDHCCFSSYLYQYSVNFIYLTPLE